jgi:crotonobetaine/carnitine-CoA ligase
MTEGHPANIQTRWQGRSPASHPLAGRDVPWLIGERARTRGAHPCLVWEPFEGPARRWTYAEFARDVARAAAGLAARNVRAGERVLIHLDNCPEFLIAWYACAHIGAVAVTTNTRSVADELAYFAAHAGVVGAITQPRFAELVNRAARGIRWLVCTDTDAGTAARPGDGADTASRFASLLGDADAAPRRAPDPTAAVGIQYTSGTTSRPKGVVWTHANALWGGRVSASHQDLHADDVHLTYLPLFHTNAQTYSVLPTFWVGGTVVLQPRFSASRFWPVSLRNRCTWTSMVPFCLKALLDHEVPPRHAYRLWGNAVSDPPTDARFGVKTIGWWGMTETITHGIVGDVHLPNRPMSIGRAAPEYDIAVVRDDGTAVDPGETGSLLIRGLPGLSLFLEYLDNPDATAASFDHGGWFKTGDRVTPDDDGFIVFADREKDMLKVGGENVAASEVERVVATVPGVSEVAVVARRDPMLDEVPVAFVIANDAAGLQERILAACRAQLADFKVPRAVYLVDELPRSTLEKIAKAELRRRVEEMAVVEGPTGSV